MNFRRSFPVYWLPVLLAGGLVLLVAWALALPGMGSGALAASWLAPARQSVTGGANHNAATPTRTPTRTPTASPTYAYPPPEWRKSGTFPDTRRDFGATTGLDGRLYAAGGRNARGVLSQAEVYDVIAGKWHTLPKMPTAREFLAVTTGADGRVYAIGGDQTTGAGLTAVEAYTPAKNTWTVLAGLPEGATGAAAVAGSDGRIYLLGGCAGQCPTANALAYTPATNTWAPIAPLPTARQWLAAVTGPDGRIYAIGGSDATGTVVTTVEAYAPDTNTWTAAPDLFRQAELTAVTVGSDGRIYVVGGHDGLHTMYQVQSWRPGDPAWLHVQDIPDARQDLAVVTGGDGRMYGLGGVENFGILQPKMLIYGPHIVLSPASGAPGATVAVSGTNFAPNATASLYWGTVATGTLLITATTDAGGNLPPGLHVTVPANAAKGAAIVTTFDSISQYPDNVRFTVTGAPPRSFRSLL